MEVNANELADKLLGSLTMEYDCDKYMEQAATMLRQQEKELTNEEITDVFVECLLPDGEFEEHEFARAILRKTQEK